MRLLPTGWAGSRQGPAERRRRWLPFALGLACGACLFLAPHEVAHAAVPEIGVETRAGCPTHKQLTAAVSRAFRTDPGPTAGGRYRLEVELRSTGVVHFLLRNGSGAVELERTIESTDCRSVAEAIALICYAHFVELPQPETANVDAQALPTPQSEPGSAAELDEKGAGEASNAATPGDETPNVGGVTEERPKNAATSAGATRAPGRENAAPEPPSTRRVETLASLGLGLAVSLPQAIWSPVGHVGLRLEGRRWALELRAETTGPYQLASGRYPLSRWPSELLLGAQLRSRNAKWELGAFAGVGLALVQVSGVSAPKDAWSASPVGGIQARFNFAPRHRKWRPWLALQGEVWLVEEHYELVPIGELGTGPRGSVGLTLGLDVRLGPKTATISRPD